MDNKQTGERLRRLRGERLCKTVANDLGISASALAMYERGERIPRDEVKIRIADYYGTSVQALFFA